MQYIFHKRLQDVFKMSSGRLQHLFARCLLQVLLKRSSRHLHEDVLQLRLEDVRLERQKNVILQKSSVRLHQDECLVGEPIRSISCSLQCNSSPQAFQALFQLMLESTQGNICEYNNSKYGQGKSGPTSQRTVYRQYAASAPPNTHSPPLPRPPNRGPPGLAPPSTKLTNQRNISAHPIVDRPKTST